MEDKFPIKCIVCGRPLLVDEATEYNPRADDSPLWGFDDRLWDLSKRMEETCRELDCLRDEILKWLISMGYEKEVWPW